MLVAQLQPMTLIEFVVVTAVVVVVGAGLGGAVAYGMVWPVAWGVLTGGLGGLGLEVAGFVVLMCTMSDAPE